MNTIISITPSVTDKSTQSMRSYLKDIYSYTPLDPEAERQLLIQARNGDRRAYDKIIKHNLRFVITVAKKYEGKGFELEDLIQEGNIGLMQAIDHFDVSVKHRFLSYAVWWIRQAISKYVSQHKDIVRVPMSQQWKAKAVKKAQAEHCNKTGFEPSDEELLELTGMSDAQLQSVMMSDVRTCFPEDNNELADPNTIYPWEDMAKQEHQRVINEVLDVLDERSRKILCSFYGIGCKQLSRSEISKEQGICGERIRQIINQALKTIQETSKAGLVELYYNDL